MAKPKKILVCEFIVLVYADHIDWGGVDSLVWWMMRRRLDEKFKPYARTINKLYSASRRPKHRK